MMTRRTKYALNAALYLAKDEARLPQQTADVAAAAGVPKKFLELILLDLKKAGIVQSKIGRKGGYALGRRPEDITVAEVMRAMDGMLAPVPCISRYRYERCEECIDEVGCGVRLAMQEAYAASLRVLEHRNLADVLKRMEESSGAALAVPMYHI